MRWWEIGGHNPSHLVCWWAIEHCGHGAFYLRSLMPGDFGKYGKGPLPRHAYDLDGKQIEEFPVKCCTCNVVPDQMTLIPIERISGYSGREHFFPYYHHGIKDWPPPTDPRTCWNCCTPTSVAFFTYNNRMVCKECYQNYLVIK